MVRRTSCGIDASTSDASVQKSQWNMARHFLWLRGRRFGLFMNAQRVGQSAASDHRRCTPTVLEIRYALSCGNRCSLPYLQGNLVSSNNRTETMSVSKKTSDSKYSVL